MRSYWDHASYGPGTDPAVEEGPLARTRKVLDRKPAGGQYQDPPLFLMIEVERMPPEVQAWVKSLGDGERWIAEFQLNLVGTRNFVKHWEYQRDYVEYMINF